MARKECQLKSPWSKSGLKKQPRGQPLYPYALCIGQYRFFLCIGLQRFGSSSSKVVTFPYKCSMRSTLCQLPAPAGKSQLFSTSVVHKVHFGSSGWKVATFKYYAQYTLAAPARKSQLFSASKCSMVQYTKYILAAPLRKSQLFSAQSTFWQLQERLQGSWLDSAWRPMSWVSVGYRFGPCKFMMPQSGFATTTWTCCVSSWLLGVSFFVFLFPLCIGLQWFWPAKQVKGRPLT